MGESKQDPKNSIPSLEDVKTLISEKQAGFALVFFGVVLIFLSAVVEQDTKNWLSIGGGIAFLVGLYLVVFRERSNSQFDFLSLKRKDTENETKIKTLEATVEQLRAELKTLHESSQKRIEAIEESEQENKKKETLIGELQTTLNNQNAEIQQKITELRELSEQMQILKEQSQPDKVAEQLSTKLFHRIGNLYDPKYGRSEPATVVDVIEEFHKKGDLQEEHFQDLLLKINMFDPTSDD